MFSFVCFFLDKWPKTASGLPSTAGTTASVAFIRRGKLYIGHVGDSGIILGYQEDNELFWRSQNLTQDHKPECIIEKERIMNSGGKVMIKSGVPRVVWNRPRLGHKGPVRRSTPIDEIPFLAVARSLGDLWSYNSALNEFVVSPDPDVHVVNIDTKKFRCLVFGTDGLWNVLSGKQAVESVRYAEEHNQDELWDWTNPSKYLVDTALKKWSSTRMRADNVSVITIMLYPPGPPPKQAINKPYGSMYSSLDYQPTSQYGQMLEQDSMDPLLQQQQQQPQIPQNHSSGSMSDPQPPDVTIFDHSTHETIPLIDTIPSNSMAVMTRYDNEDSYMNSFAESYNSLLNTNYENSLYNPQEPMRQQMYDEQQLVTETYSLTNLITRTEQRSQLQVRSPTNFLYSPQHHSEFNPTFYDGYDSNGGVGSGVEYVGVADDSVQINEITSTEITTTNINKFDLSDSETETEPETDIEENIVPEERVMMVVEVEKTVEIEENQMITDACDHSTDNSDSIGVDIFEPPQTRSKDKNNQILLKTQKTIKIKSLQLQLNKKTRNKLKNFTLIRNNNENNIKIEKMLTRRGEILSKRTLRSKNILLTPALTTYTTNKTIKSSRHSTTQSSSSSNWLGTSKKLPNPIRTRQRVQKRISH